jgi:hypothetical protein
MKSQNSRNKGFPYLFCLLMEGPVSRSVQNKGCGFGGSQKMLSLSYRAEVLESALVVLCFCVTRLCAVPLIVSPL